MSAWIKSYSLADISDQAQIVAQVECDTFADLPAVNEFSPRVLLKSSTAHVIEGNTMHELNSAGRWIPQEKSPFADVYTKDQVNNLLSDIDSTIVQVVSRLSDCIASIVDEGAKNKLNVFAVQSQTISGITWTINADGTVSASGTATSNSFLYLIPNNTNIAYGVETKISGCPSGGSSTTYEIQVAMAGGTTYHDYGDGETIPSSYVYRYFVCAVRSGQTVSNLTFKPMIRDSWKSSTFVPYSPTNEQLAALIRSYHP